jgi:hypothetical protein
MLARCNANCFSLVSRLLKLVKIVESRDFIAVLPTRSAEAVISKAVAFHRACVSGKMLFFFISGVRLWVLRPQLAYCASPG